MSALWLPHVPSCTLLTLLTPLSSCWRLLNPELLGVYDLKLGRGSLVLRPYWEIPCCAVGAASARLRGPHVVIVVAVFNLCKFLTEMGLQVVWVWSCRGEGHLASISMCQTRVTKADWGGETAPILEIGAATYDFNYQWICFVFIVLQD